jgi:hypothetical protein
VAMWVLEPVELYRGAAESGSNNCLWPTMGDVRKTARAPIPIIRGGLANGLNRPESEVPNLAAEVGFARESGPRLRA